MLITDDIGMNWRNQTNENLILLDEDFLATLSEQKNRQIYARIIALDINENPIDLIEGRVTGGSINIDGNSTVRRTCSLTLICDQIDINDFYWGIKTKFKLFIGLQNNLIGEYAYTDSSGKYPSVVWFPQGTYVVATFNTSISTNNCTISISGKDKMSLLNGDLGGSLFASIDFGTEETQIKTMTPVGTLDDTSSETLMAKKYYFQPNESPDIVLSADTEYAFVLNDQSGTYAKDGNLYRKVIPTYDENNLRIPDGYKHYDIYQQVNKPEDLFNKIGKEYQIGSFYEKQYSTVSNEANNYYLLAKTSMGEIDYYSLKTLYTLGYETVIKHIPIEKIIRESVHTYANEPYHNIVINDLEDYGLEQLTYKGDKVLFAIRNADTGHFVNMMFADAFFKSYNNALGWIWNWNSDNSDIDSIVMDRNTGEQFEFDTLSSENTSITGTVLELKERQYKIPDENSDSKNFRTVAKIVYGNDIGYRLTDLTYPGDLISSIGENLTSILDKIKTMLDDFEYFYDLDGRFVFQRKKIYTNTSWSQLTETEDESYVTYGNDKKKFSFNFEGNRLISAFQNSPALNNLRNDFVVWGKRKGVSGADIAIHARYAIDKKPVYYKALSNEIYVTDLHYAYEQIAEIQRPEEEIINETIAKKQQALKNFVFLYPVDPELHLASPVRKGSYGWEPGWWDIRDWARYYNIVMTGEEAGEDPNGTMKFYSSNDEYGCISVGKLLEDGVPIGVNSLYENYHVWLLEIKSSGTINYGHGFSPYNALKTRKCDYYTSKITERSNGTMQVELTKTDQTGDFHPPYSGCSDSHTYLYFLNKINSGYDQAVYFYNPNFPFGETEEEIIVSETIEKKYEEIIKKYHIHIVDWREIIYQMALDFFAGQGCSEKNPIYTFVQDNEGNRTPEICCTDPDHFLYEVGLRNPYYYPTGYTGYEQYYTDLQGFWRELYNPEYTPEPVYSKGKYKITPLKSETSQYYIKTKAWQNAELTDINIDYYFCGDDERINTQINNIEELNVFVDENENNSLSLTPIQLKYSSFKVSFDEFLSETDKGKRLYWNRAVFESPETLNFWFDFLDSDTELASFSVKSVGDRTKVVNDDKAGAIFYKEIPGLILYDANEAQKDNNGEATLLDSSKLHTYITENSGYVFVYLPKGFSQYLTISYRGTSVKNKIDELIYQFSYCIENVSITAIPVYYLQPNTRIYVQDKNTGVEGEYIVSKITIPLTYNGTMSISAFKAPERLY